MKNTFILIGLALLLGGCSKTDLFGYTSYDQCMLEIMEQPHKGMGRIADDYCRELFPNEQ